MYHKSILLMNLTKHYDNGFMIFQEKEELHAPLATLNYHFYENSDGIENFIQKHANEIQCVIGTGREIAPGQSQLPGLADYADKVDTMDFLSKVN